MRIKAIWSLIALLVSSLLVGCASAAPSLGGSAKVASAKNWTLWAPNRMAQIVVADNATENERDAATELAKFIALMSGQKASVVSEGAAQNAGAIYVGSTRRAAQLSAAKWPAEARLREESYRLFSDAATQTLVIEAGGSMALKYGVYDFLRRYGGVRWYLPTDLFQVVPQKKTLQLSHFDLLETPSFAPRTFSYIEQGAKVSYPGEQDPQFKHDRWALRNRLSVDGRLHYGFNHNLFRVIVPSRDFDAHPEWFPLIGGTRFRPPSDDYQQWQPELTDPAVVEKFVQAGRDFFKNSSHWWEWYSLSINDGDGWSQSEAAQKINGAPRTFRGRVVQSNVYYDFVNKVATQLLKEFPDRQIGLIAYYAVEAPPTNLQKLPPNVNVVITQEAAQHFDANYAKQDQELVRDWMPVANGNVYRYEYSTMFWTMPRYYPTLLAQDAREMKQLGLKGYFTEDAPMWANNTGPLLWLSTQLWWDPQQDQKKLVAKFCNDLFGPASPAMQAYFGIWEKAWMRQKSGRFFAGLFNIPQQVAIYTPEDRRAMQAQIERARRLAGSGIEKQRVDFFVQGWKLIDFHLRQYEQSQLLSGGTTQAKIDAAVKLLALVDEGEAYDKQFKAGPPLLSGSYNWGQALVSARGSWPDVMRARAMAAFLPALETVRNDPQELAALLQKIKVQLANTSAAPVADLLKTWMSGAVPANELQNTDFENDARTARGDGLPPKWQFWAASRGALSYQENRLRLTGADTGVLIQEVPVKSGQVVLATLRYRVKPGAQTPVMLSVRWTNEKGWFPFPGTAKEGIYDLIVSSAPSEEWQTLSVIGRAPEGATHAQFQCSASGQSADDWIEITKPYLGIK